MVEASMGQRRIFQSHNYTTANIPPCRDRLEQCRNTCGKRTSHARRPVRPRPHLTNGPSTAVHVHPQTHEQGSKDGIGNGAGGVGVGDGGGGGRGDGLRMREPMHHLSEGEEEREGHHEGHALSARRDARVRELNGRAHTIFDEDAEEEGPEGKTLRGIEPLQPRTLSEAGTPVRA